MSQTSVLSNLSKVPPFPPIAARLLSLLSDESANITQVADLVGSDATLTARLLQSVNSLEFGLVAPVTNVLQALALLGLERTRQVTIAVATAVYVGGALKTEELRLCWEHSIATAILADQIAQACGAFKANAYTAGIIHDIGRLGLLRAYPKDYERIIRDAATRCIDLLDFEREQFGMHHAEAGQMLAEQWKLPAECQTIAGRHHDRCDGYELDLLRIVHIACRAADSLGYCITRPLVPLDFETILAELPAHARERLRMSPDEMRERIHQRVQAYQGHVEQCRAEFNSDAAESVVAEARDQQTAPKSSSQPRGLYVLIAVLLAIATAIVSWFRQ